MRKKTTGEKLVRLQKFISFIALFVFALILYSPPDLRAAEKSSATVKPAPKIFGNQTPELSAITTATAKSEFIFQRNKFILPRTIRHGYRIAFSPPAKIYSPKDKFEIFYPPDAILNFRRKPEIVRMM